MRTALLLVLVLLLAGLPAQAASAHANGSVRAHAPPFAGDFSGGSFVKHGDAHLAQVAAGEAASDLQETATTRFRIGSLTKLFTSAAVLRLLRQGLVALASSVCTTLAPCPEAWRSAAARHLVLRVTGEGARSTPVIPIHEAIEAPFHPRARCLARACLRRLSPGCDRSGGERPTSARAAEAHV